MKKKKGCLRWILLVVIVAFGAYKVLHYYQPAFYRPVETKIRLVFGGLYKQAKNKIESIGKKPYLEFEYDELALHENEPIELRLDYYGDLDGLSYSVFGDSIVISDHGIEGITVMPVEDGDSVILVSASDGREGKCVVSVSLYRNILELMEREDVTAKVVCGNIQEGKVSISNHTDHAIFFLTIPGTYMQAAGSGYQNMMIMEAIKDWLPANTTTTYTVDTCCMNIHRSIPTSGNKFSLALSDNETLCKLAEYCLDHSVDYSVRQAATWILTDKASYSDCMTLRSSTGGYIISQNEYQQAVRLVEDLGGKNSIRYDVSDGSSDEKLWISMPDTYDRDSGFNNTSVFVNLRDNIHVYVYTIEDESEFPSRDSYTAEFSDQETRNRDVIQNEIEIAGYSGLQTIWSYENVPGHEEYYASYIVYFDDTSLKYMGVVFEIIAEDLDVLSGEGILDILNSLEYES